MSYDNLSLEAKEKVDNLWVRLSSINNSDVTSCIRMSRCYLTNKDYDYDVCSEDMYSFLLLGSFNRYPFNLIQYHIENEWLIPCFQNLYLMDSQIFPHTQRNKYHNLPKIIKIERSSGKIYDAMVMDQTFGIKIRKSRSQNDENDKFYVRVSWIEGKEKIDEEDMETMMNTFYLSFKDIRLEDIVRLNPGIKESGLELRINLTDSNKNELNDHEKEVIEYCNSLYKEWVSNKLVQVIDSYREIVKITINYM